MLEIKISGKLFLTYQGIGVRNNPWATTFTKGNVMKKYHGEKMPKKSSGFAGLPSAVSQKSYPKSSYGLGDYDDSMQGIDALASKNNKQAKKNPGSRS
jgi:hypothetical protein